MNTKKKSKSEIVLSKMDPATLKKQMRAGQWKLAKILGWRLRLKNITPAELDKTGSGFMMRLFIPEYTPEFKKRVDGIPKAVRNLLGSELKGKMQTREGEGGGLIVILPVGTGMLKKIMKSAFGNKDVEKMEIEQRNRASLSQRRVEPAVASTVETANFKRLFSGLKIAKNAAELITNLKKIGFKPYKKSMDPKRRAKNSNKRALRLHADEGDCFVEINIDAERDTVSVLGIVYDQLDETDGQVRVHPGHYGLSTHRFDNIAKFSKNFENEIEATLYDAQSSLEEQQAKAKKRNRQHKVAQKGINKNIESANVELAKRPMSPDELKNELVQDTKKKFDKTKKKLGKLKPGVSGEVFKGLGELKKAMGATRWGFQADEADYSSVSVSFFLPKHPDVRFIVTRTADDYEAAMSLPMTKTVKDDNFLLDASATGPTPVAAVAAMFMRAAEQVSDRRNEFMSDFGKRMYWANNPAPLKKLAAAGKVGGVKKKSAESQPYGAEHEEDGE